MYYVIHWVTKAQIGQAYSRGELTEAMRTCRLQGHEVKPYGNSYPPTAFVGTPVEVYGRSTWAVIYNPMFKIRPPRITC